MIDGINLETIAGICTIVSASVAVFSVVFPYLKRYDTIQIRFGDGDGQSYSVISIRNQTSRKVYINYLGIYKCNSCIHDVFNDTTGRNEIIIEPNQDYELEISSDKLQNILEKQINEIWFKSNDQKKRLYRIAFRICVESSQGNLFTPWFKITKRRGNTRDNPPQFGTYDGYKLSFYPLRGYIGTYAYWWLFAIAISLYIASVSMVLHDPESLTIQLETLLVQVLIIISSSLFASGGFKEPCYVGLMAVGITLPYFLAMTYVTGEVLMLTVWSIPFLFAYVHIKKTSGWSL